MKSSRVLALSFLAALAISMSAYAQNSERAQLADSLYSKCSFDVVRRIGGLWSGIWQYWTHTYSFEVSNPDSTPVSGEVMSALINDKARLEVNDVYQQIIDRGIRRMITPLQETSANGWGQWFFHYEPVPYGSGPQNLEETRLYSIVPSSVQCQ